MKKDFFISYTGKDKDWAVWIAWQLEAQGYSTIIQAWDFRPGGNFVFEMQKALQQAERTISVFSETYLQSVYATPEWSAVFAQDPLGVANRLIPVKIGECQPEGLLTALIWIDLIGLSEIDARSELLSGVQRERAKPEHPPAFPGRQTVQEKPSFPAESGKQNLYVPKIRKEKTDLDIRNFIEAAFQTLRQYFSDAASVLMSQHPEVTVKIMQLSDIKMMAEAFVHGKSQARCQIWINQSHSPQIGYNEGHAYLDGDNSYNEILSISNNQTEYGLESLMRFHWEQQLSHFEFSHLSAEEASEYLWRRFTSGLER